MLFSCFQFPSCFFFCFVFLPCSVLLELFMNSTLFLVCLSIYLPIDFFFSGRVRVYVIHNLLEYNGMNILPIWVKYNNLISLEVSLHSTVYNINCLNYFLSINLELYHIMLKFFFQLWSLILKKKSLLYLPTYILSHCFFLFYVYIPCFLFLSFPFYFHTFFYPFFYGSSAGMKFSLVSFYLRMSGFPLHSQRIFSLDMEFYVDRSFLLLTLNQYCASFF